MSSQNRPLSSNLRHPSLGGNTGQSPILVARINEKRAELENLKQLRDLSAGLAEQMQTLEEKLATLADGTEAVATVLSNWHNVLRAINMASLHIPKPKASNGTAMEEGDMQQPEPDVPLPQTLVRIPTQPSWQQLEPQTSSGGRAGGE
ncbi:dash complex subunit dad2 [Lasallia pustulata]|uniref:DASH complex subunit DAD2 n=1 Tax=Lasallia pustulata TaxID=136370 RepID=A0A1W5CTI5_9LECA|nr:dash complex subunit dad2 [Lasallia pustulata]